MYVNFFFYSYPLQNLNPLFYLQQSQLNASTNAIGKQKEKVFFIAFKLGIF